MSPRKSLLFLSILILSSMFSTNGVSAKVPTVITEDFESRIVGFVYSVGSNYSEVQSSINGSDWADTTNETIWMMRIGQNFGGGKYWIERNFYRLDTRSLPSNIEIQNTTLRVEGNGKFWTVDEQIRVQKWTDGNDGLGLDDYHCFDGINYDDGSVTWESWIVGWNNFTVLNYSLIQTNGFTDVCLRSSRDINVTQPSQEERVLVNHDLTSITLSVTYRVIPKGGSTPAPRPLWERIREQLGQFLSDHITTPFWNMWVETNITFAGILASIVVVISVYLGLECYHWIRKPKKKLKIAKIRVL